MIIRAAKSSLRVILNNQPRYWLLDHSKMEQVEKKLFMDKQKTLKLKAKFLWKETKYTIVQGSKDLWKDTKWIIKLYKTKSYSEFTGYEMLESQRVKIDMLKFIPYSFILVVPFAELCLPFLLWLFPNAVPSFFIFDTAWDKRIEKHEQVQQEAHKILIDRLMEILILKFHKQPIELSRYEFINQSYIEIIDELKEFLDFEKFNSDELILVLDFIGAGNYVTGTGIINKLVNLFTLSIPRVIYKTLRFLYRKIFRVDLQPYEDPWFIKGNFDIFKLNYFPFEALKRKFLLYQINRKFRLLYDQDVAFEKYGMDDIEGSRIKEFARERGLAALSCYETLKNLIRYDWVQFTTNEKFMSNNNAKLWYSIIMYNFLKESSRDLN